MLEEVKEGEQESQSLVLADSSIKQDFNSKRYDTKQENIEFSASSEHFIPYIKETKESRVLRE